MNPDALVAGAGIWGCTVARRLAEAGRRVLVLEKRTSVGGNCRCEIDPATNIEVHLYGSHIFHTQLPDVWAFVNRFTTFNGYQHKVLARHDGKTYFLPLGLALVNKFFGVELLPSEVESFLSDPKRKNALFGYRFGPLPWRSLRFETERLAVADAQGTSVVNYVDADVPFTRQHEFRHYHPEPVGPLSQAEGLKSGAETIVMQEYPAAWRPGDEPYYPVNNESSSALLARYQAEAAKVRGLVVGGRLGAYRYLDMDKAIDAALKLDLGA